MFMITIHKGSFKRVLAMLGCAVVLCGVILGANTLADGARATAAAANGNVVKSAEDMANFLLGYGVEVDVGTAQVLQVTIPKKFDKSFKAFNEVIGTIGMDLSKHKGKLVEKWILQSPNRTVEDQTAYAVLLVRDDKVIGGYLLYQPSGEVIGLRDTLDIATLAPNDAAVLSVQPDAGDGTDAAVLAPEEQAADAVDTDADETECVADEVTAPDPAQTLDDAVDLNDPQPAAEAAAEGEAVPAENDIFPVD